jgi:hypothetical protein
MKKSLIGVLIVLFILGVLFMVGCKITDEEDTGDLNTRQKFEGTSAYVSSFIYDLLWDVYNTAIALPASATYDEGWWKITITLTSGETAEIEIQFQNQNQIAQQYYNVNTTFYILVKGSSAGTLGSLTFDLILSGVQATSNVITVNGTGTSEYMGMTSTFEVTNLKISKTTASYPQSGTIKISFSQTSVTITYNGTQYVTATYTFLGFSYTITINLATGDYS